MSSSRSNFQSLMRRFGKPTDMEVIPEEKIGRDGRPISQVSQHFKSDDKRGSTNTVVSEFSTATTQVGSHLGIDVAKANGGPHSPQPGDLLFVPPNVKTPTTFGPNNEYKAVPSIIEYSTARGKSRVSVREATPEEAQEAAGSNMPVISEVGQNVRLLPADGGSPPHGDVPTIPPPPQLEPIRMNSPPLSSEGQSPPRSLRAPVLSQGSESIRTSATSIRTSTTSIRTSTASEVSQPTFGGTTDADTIVRVPSNSTYPNPPSSPPRQAGSPPYEDVKYFDHHSGSPVPSPPRHGINYTPSNASMHSRSRVPLYQYPRATTPTTLPDSLPGSDVSQSRFSWHVTKTERTKNWFTRWFIEWWAMELLSWLFSAICMMIIIIVLWKADGKPMPKWKLGVSINAFIAIFSGFAKSALLLPTAEALGQLKWNWFRSGEKKMMDFEVMDSASRGPWGSMILLGKTKGITLASIGAAIILLSLPLDLFFQQIVTYPDVAIVYPNANASISRAVVYDPDPGYQYRKGIQVMPWDFMFNALIYPYWLGKGINPGVAVDCPTGNCTFDPFYTLGIDFQCVEMSPKILQFGCKNTSAEWMSTVQYAGPGESPNVTSCGYYLNVPGSIPQLMAGYEIENGTVGEVLATRFFALSDIITNELWFNGSINFPDIKNPQVDFILASTPGGFDGAVRNNTPVLHECEVHWVVNKLNSSVVNGNLTEVRTETHQFPSDLTNSWDPEDSDIYLANFNLSLPDLRSAAGPHSTFGMNNVSARGVWQFWTQIAPATLLRPSAKNPVQSGPVLKYAWLDSPPHLLQVFDASLPWDTPNNITDQMAQAVYVANQIVRRNTLSQRKEHGGAVGTAWQHVVLVHIRWEWITLPVALLLFALFFLSTTIWKSSKDKQHIGIWKTSALAILFNGLGEDVQTYVGAGNKKMGYTREKARDIKVHLDDD